jgi:outer membrane protein assembly factor BamB
MKLILVFRSLLLQVIALTSLMMASAAAADWPQFQGPNRDGSSPEKGLARTWPAEGPKVLWSFPLGPGFAAPAIRDGEVYILDRVQDKQDVMRCLDFQTGKELWNYAYDAPGKISHNGSRTPPTVDEKYVYSVGMMGDLYCIDRKTHQPVWKKNLQTDFNPEKPGWGFAQAPSLYKDLVILAPQAPDAFVAAFKKDTGEVVWKSPSLGLIGYTTPVVTKLGGVDQVVMIGACAKGGAKPGKVAGLSLENGTILWTYDGFQCYIPIPYPATLPDDRLFMTGGYDAGSAMIQVKQEGGKFVVKEIFKTSACGSQVHQPLFFGDHLYVNSNSNEREDGMLCLALDGQVKWKTRDSWSSTTFERGGLLLADSMILTLDGKKGVLYLVDPSPDGFKELAHAQVFSGKEIWAPMALSEGKLLLRNQEEMKCLDLKNP